MFRLVRTKNSQIECYYSDVEADFNPIHTYPNPYPAGPASRNPHCQPIT